MMQMMLIGVLFLIFWLLVIRPQQRRANEHKEMVSALRRGDRIVTAGGILGTVMKVLPDDEVKVEIAANVRVKVIQSTIHTVLTKTEPVKAEKTGKDKPAKKGKTAEAEAAEGAAAEEGADKESTTG